MDWNKGLILGVQTVVFVTFAVMVCLGHNGPIQDAMLAIAGSLVGTGLYTTIKRKAPSEPTK